jgi:hypothetical protein
MTMRCLTPVNGSSADPAFSEGTHFAPPIVQGQAGDERDDRGRQAGVLTQNIRHHRVCARDSSIGVSLLLRHRNFQSPCFGRSSAIHKWDAACIPSPFAQRLRLRHFCEERQPRA